MNTMESVALAIEAAVAGKVMSMGWIELEERMQVGQGSVVTDADVSAFRHTSGQVLASLPETWDSPTRRPLQGRERAHGDDGLREHVADLSREVRELRNRLESLQEQFDGFWTEEE